MVVMLNVKKSPFLSALFHKKINLLTKIVIFVYASREIFNAIISSTNVKYSLTYLCNFQESQSKNKSIIHDKYSSFHLYICENKNNVFSTFLHLFLPFNF